MREKQNKKTRNDILNVFCGMLDFFLERRRVLRNMFITS